MATPSAPGDPAARTFSLAEAIGMLPQVRRTLTALRGHLQAMQALRRECRQLEEVGRDDRGELILAADHRAASARFQEHQEAAGVLLGGITEAGCQVKDIAAGLCDFPGVLDGQPVLWCWQADEPTIAFYHGRDDGYAGRRRIPPGTP